MATGQQSQIPPTEPISVPISLFYSALKILNYTLVTLIRGSFSLHSTNTLTGGLYIFSLLENLFTEELHQRLVNGIGRSFKEISAYR